MGRFPEPVEPVNATILIQTGSVLLSKAVPKSTAIELFENVFPVVSVPVVVGTINVVGAAPIP